MPAGKGYEQALSLWSIQETLLQSYRSLFVTSESIVFAVAVGVSTSSAAAFTLLSIVGLLILWMWHVVCGNRGVDVSFAQWMILRCEEGSDVEVPLTSFKKFQGELRVDVDGYTAWRSVGFLGYRLETDKPYLSLARSPTRRWMEWYLPCGFIALWVIVAFMAPRFPMLNAA
jgi:hypothetical protein